jgi:hypothetical protein
MAAARWNATVVDSPDSEPYAVVGDLVVAVRTPRSQDFVTIEVAPSARCGPDLAHRPELVLSPTPYPCLTQEWRGEVRIGSTVHFEVAGESYSLTLSRLAEPDPALPWITCDLSVERD